jgi:NAD(P)-dependent dehydrogenase (short-subunit alcohol dehydrogenase family)
MRVAVAARTVTQIEETAAAIRDRGGHAIAIEADVTDERAVETLWSTVEDRLGPVDLLINNAGYGRPFGPAWECEPAEWWRNLEVNLKGAYLCCAFALRAMTARKRGRIINVASGAGTVSIPYMSAYVTAKAALIRLTEVLADEARAHGVCLFAIQPGTVRTAMSEDLMNSEAGSKWLPWFGEIFEEGKDDSFDPAVALVRYLASGKADALSGRFFSVPWDPAEMAARADEIRARSLYLLRLRSLENV